MAVQHCFFGPDENREALQRVCFWEDLPTHASGRDLTPRLLSGSLALGRHCALVHDSD